MKKNSALSGENFSAGYENVVTRQMSKQYDYDTKSRIVAAKKDFLFENIPVIVGAGVAYSPYFSSEYNSDDNANISVFGFGTLNDLILSFNFKNYVGHIHIGFPLAVFRR